MSQSANKGYKLTQTDHSFWTRTPRKLLLLFRFLGHHVNVFRTEQISSKLKKVEHNLEHWKIERFGGALNLTSKIEFYRDEPSRRDRNKFLNLLKSKLGQASIVYEHLRKPPV